MGFGEDGVIHNPEGEVTATIEAVTDTAEVANHWEGHRGKAEHEFPHAGTPEGNHAAERHAFTHLKARDALGRVGDDRLLTGQLGDFLYDFGHVGLVGVSLES